MGLTLLGLFLEFLTKSKFPQPFLRPPKLDSAVTEAGKLEPMARKDRPAKKQTAASRKLNGGEKPLRGAERSAYFARREAAKVLRTVLEGDARRRAVGSIKSLVYSPSIRNKRATFALVCETLKHLPVIKDVLRATNVLNSKWKRQEELLCIIAYDILFGKESLATGDAEKLLLSRKDKLRSALVHLLEKKRVKHIKELMPQCKISDMPKPRYVRVNTLKMDVESAILELTKQYAVDKDDMVPGLLKLPPSTDLHKHPLVINGSIFMQGRASSMVAAALEPKPGWWVLDACSAPGNKTVHLAAIMKGKGKIIACELDKQRVKRLEATVRLAGATNVKVKHEDFLKLNPEEPCCSKIRAILLDPSCSGSGTAIDRLDHLLPSYAAVLDDTGNSDRLMKLAAFQKKALEHAFSFPAAERIVYSTCSIHQIENEDVVKSVLPLAASHGFQLAPVHPQWPRRGLPVLDGSQHLLRTDLVEDGEGFFIALFVRKADKRPQEYAESETCEGYRSKRFLRKKTEFVNYFFNNRFRMLLYPPFRLKKQR
ncbi:25S rRNA (cytosine-C(5))-methyltransferase NSUN5 isoform X4 [Coffea arabica]|uniref:25S rRNA (Cytosine-C(5))-methyltransferase NSUN5 isoform X4 n=1 Tax=Coffea arabica TaxID=13443 RepID=A0A6P6U5S3_COFAR|nr:probable 28S rRNA (cytosine-C(5))-methyltransferase isoform X4 [Coffea arabica]